MKESLTEKIYTELRSKNRLQQKLDAQNKNRG